MRILQGTISGLKMTKTVTVTVTRYKKHPKYQKRFRVTKKYHAHCEEEMKKSLNVGDAIYILESHPLSKLKRWVVVTAEQRKALVEKDRANKTTEAAKASQLKALSDKKSLAIETKKRKMNSNKRKTLAAAAPAVPETPAPEAAAETKPAEKAPEAPAAKEAKAEEKKEETKPAEQQEEPKPEEKQEA